MKNKIIIGIDQSYQDCGISIAFNSHIRAISDVNLKPYKNYTEKRKALRIAFKQVLQLCKSKASKLDSCEIICIIERIRLRSSKPGTDNFINFPYIKNIGSLNSTIVDLAYEFDVPVYSVDTRSWKAQVVGNSTKMNNKYGIDPEKWRTILFVIHTLKREKDILQAVSNRKTKGVVKTIDGIKYTYNDNRADSACIALYGFIPEKKQRLELEQ